VLALVRHSPGTPRTVAWWVGVAVAAVVTIAAVLTYRGITVAPAIARWVWEWFAVLNWPPGPEATRDARLRSITGAASAAAWSGLREYQGQLVAVIAVDEPADAPSEQQCQKVSFGYFAGGGGLRSYLIVCMLLI
jgi:type VII secretion protein EccE